VRTAIFSRLTATRALTTIVASRVFHAEAPPGATHPFLILNKQSGTPTYSFGGLAFDDHAWLVKCVDRGGSSAIAEDAQRAIDAALTDAPLVIAGGVLLYLKRTSDLEYIETIDGVQYRHHGALFRVVLSDAT
jgi:hypothetical protein